MKRSFWWKAGCLAPLIYILICVHHKFYVNRLVNEQLRQKKVTIASFKTTPAPLQNFLWYVYAKTDTGFYTGYINIFHGGRDYTPVFHHQHNQFLNEVHDHESLQKLIRFSQGNYTIENVNDTLYFQDIRFGQSYGWENAGSPFVFRYALIHGGNSRLHIQRGRMSSLQSNHLKSLARRMFVKN
jgi:inner membrane protein